MRCARHAFGVPVRRADRIPQARPAVPGAPRFERRQTRSVMPLKRLLAVFVLIASAAMAGEGIWIRVAPDGWASSLSEAPRSVDDGDAIWNWTPDCAPRRPTSVDPAPCAALDVVTVRVIAA